MALLNWKAPGWATSSSTMVKVAVAWLPSVAPPVGVSRKRLTVSLPSTRESSAMGIVNDLVVSPTPKLRVPLVAV